MATTNATAAKGAAPKKGFTGIKSGFAVILVCILIAECLYVFGAGYLGNFRGTEDATGLPFHFFQDKSFEPDGIVGTVYKGGFIVPIIWSLFITVIALAIERWFAISTANVVLAALTEYKKQQGTDLETEKKVLAIQKTIEEATALEMPMMQENLPIIGTIVTLGTLMGLLGTVMGMIKSFSAMGSGEGGADSSALSVGISEALVNTASGIATGAAAVIAYNYYTNKIDRLTFAIDELGFTIVETFKTTQK